MPKKSNKKISKKEDSDDESDEEKDDMVIEGDNDGTECVINDAIEGDNEFFTEKYDTFKSK